MKNAVLYARVSTDEQSRGNSLTYQMSYLREFCKRNNYQVVKEVDEDHSAKTFNRPRWKELVQFCRDKKNGVNIVLFTRWDRFSRNIEEAWRQLDYFTKLGIEVNSAENPLDFSVPDNKYVKAFYLVSPEVENDKISKRTREGTHEAQVAGKFTNKAPKGYVNIT